MALNYETLIRAATKSPEQRTTTEITDVIFPWLKQSLKKKQGIFQKISDDVIHDICKTIILERRPAWDVVIQQNDPGDKFYIILQGAVNIHRLDDETNNPIEVPFDPLKTFSDLDSDPDQRDELINRTFGNYVITLGGGCDFGERALVTNEPRSATVMTVTSTDLFVVDRDVFSRTLKSAHEKELQEKTEFINRCPFFSSWSARLKRLVSLSLERGRFTYDNMLYKQGSPANAVYFIWSGEVKVSMDPLFHWLQYPQLLPASDPMKQRALDFFLPIVQQTQMTTNNVVGESFAIKRRHMTFAEAEKERRHRTIDLALLNIGDMIGLESYVCDLATHMNSARCTAPCDLFYILKHNFLRLQKRHGTQGLTERLRETVLLSLQAYPTKIHQLPLFNALMKRQLAPNTNDDQQTYYNKQSWLLHVSTTNNTATHSYSRRLPTKSSTGVRTSHHGTFGTATATAHYVNRDHVQVTKLEDRLKRWHVQMSDRSASPTRPSARYSLARATRSALTRTSVNDRSETQSDGAAHTTSSTSNRDEPVPTPLLVELGADNVETRIEPPISIFAPQPSKSHLSQVRIYSKQERYEDLRAYLKQAWKEFNKRPIPSVY